MFDRWCLTGFPDAVWITRRSAHALPDGAEPIAGAVAAWHVDEWIGGDGLGRDLLAELHRHVVGPATEIKLADLERMRAVVRAALGEGSLVAYRLKVKLSGGPVENSMQDGPPVELAPVEEKTWIGIELVDDDDPQKPVPYAKYRVEVPDGSIREGILDDKGRAVIRGIDPGECQVSFPELHAADWKQL